MFKLTFQFYCDIFCGFEICYTLNMTSGRPKYFRIGKKQVSAQISHRGAFLWAKYNITYSEAESAMESAGISEFHVFDCLRSPNMQKQLTYVENNESKSANERSTSQAVATLVEIANEDQEKVSGMDLNLPTLYIGNTGESIILEWELYYTHRRRCFQ